MFFKNIFWILNNTSLRLASLQDGRLDPCCRRHWPPLLLASRHLAGGNEERGFALFSKSTVLLVLFHIFLSSKIIRLGFGSSFQCLGSGFLFCTGWIRCFLRWRRIPPRGIEICWPSPLWKGIESIFLFGGIVFLAAGNITGGGIFVLPDALGDG